MTSPKSTLANSDSMDYVHHALALFKAADFSGAYGDIEQAITLNPNNAIAWVIKASVCRKLGQKELANSCFQRALELDPSNADAWGNYANFLHQEKREEFQTIKSLYQKALQIAPTNPSIWNNFAFFCNDHHCIAEANHAFEKAVTFERGSENYWIDLGISHFQLNQSTQSIVCYEHALAINPNSHKAKYNLSLALLRLGQYERAWPLYESRFDIGGRLIRKFEHIPRLKKINDLSGRSLLIWAEQGFGDTLQFVRFLRHLNLENLRATFFCQEELRTLLQHHFPELEVVSELSSSRSYDYQIPLLGLPQIIANPGRFLKNSPPYLRCDFVNLAANSHPLGGISKKRSRIALSCSGNPKHRDDFFRSIAMHHFDFLNGLGDVVLLQQEIRQSDLPYYQTSGFSFSGQKLKTFADSAALLKTCDLVVSVDTALVHLAGALGMPTYCLLSLNSDWRWGEGAKSSPYESVTPIAQSSLGDWQKPILELKTRLNEVLYSGNINKNLR